MNFTSTESFATDIFKYGSYICGWLMVGITAMGLVGNFLTFLVFSNIRMRSPINVLLAGLSLIDSFLLVFGTATFLPIAFYSLLGDEWYLRNMPVLTYVIVFVYPVAMMAQTSSVWTLSVITVERYLAVCHPFSARVMCTVQRALAAFICINVSAILYNFCRFWEHVVSVCDGLRCPLPLLREIYYYRELYMLWMYLIFMFVLPFALLVAFNLRIVFVLKKAVRTRERMSRRDKREFKTTEMMLIVILLFLLCNSLAFVLTVIDVWKVTAEIQQSLYFFITSLSNVLVEINSAANLPIYFKFGGKFRREFLRLLKKFCCCMPVGRRLSSYNSVNMYSEDERPFGARSSIYVAKSGLTNKLEIIAKDTNSGGSVHL